MTATKPASTVTLSSQATTLFVMQDKESAYLWLLSSSNGLLCLGLLCSHGLLPCLMLPCRGSSRPFPSAAGRCLPLSSLQGCRPPSSLLPLGSTLLHPGALQQTAYWIKAWSWTCGINMIHLAPSPLRVQGKSWRGSGSWRGGVGRQGAGRGVGACLAWVARTHLPSDPVSSLCRREEGGQGRWGWGGGGGGGRGGGGGGGGGKGKGAWGKGGLGAGWACVECKHCIRGNPFLACWPANSCNTILQTWCRSGCLHTATAVYIHQHEPPYCS